VFSAPASGAPTTEAAVTISRPERRRRRSEASASTTSALARSLLRRGKHLAERVLGLGGRREDRSRRRAGLATPRKTVEGISSRWCFTPEGVVRRRRRGCRSITDGAVRRRRRSADACGPQEQYWMPRSGACPASARRRASVRSFTSPSGPEQHGSSGPRLGRRKRRTTSSSSQPCHGLTGVSVFVAE
jgi:hypothetical protein